MTTHLWTEFYHGSSAPLSSQEAQLTENCIRLAKFYGLSYFLSDKSRIAALGAFFLTEAMPFSIDALLAYDWLLPTTCLLAATRTK